MELTVLMVSPHPDDEALAAPMTMQGLAARGHRVINAACSLGRPADHERRRAELAESCRRAGFELRVADPAVPISSTDDLDVAKMRVTTWIRCLIGEHRPDVVVSPDPDEPHHGHSVVGLAVRDAIAWEDWRGPWWQWSIWGQLVAPTLYAPHGQADLDHAGRVLSAYAGENERNDYTDMLLGRARLTAALGSELVFGFGTARAATTPFAEVLRELRPHGEEWSAGAPRVLDLDNPLAGVMWD